MDFVKRLGQHHIMGGDGKTKCGMPMLGSNYKNMIPKDEWKPCRECMRRDAKPALTIIFPGAASFDLGGYKDDCKVFVGVWGEDFAKPGCELMELSEFSEDRGYSDENRVDIDQLENDEVWRCEDYLSHIVMRIR